MKWKSRKTRRAERRVALAKWHILDCPKWPVEATAARTGTHPMGTVIWLEPVACRIDDDGLYLAPLTILLTDPWVAEEAERYQQRMRMAQGFGQAGIPGPPGPMGPMGPPGQAGWTIGMGHQGIAGNMQQYAQHQAAQAGLFNPLGGIGGQISNQGTCAPMGTLHGPLVQNNQNAKPLSVTVPKTP
jgi:hypothetical protein